MSIDNLTDLFSAMLASSQAESDAAFQHLKDHPQLQGAIKALNDRRPDRFRLALAYPMSKVISGLIHEYAGRDGDGQFLLEHNAFVESHLRNLIEKYEGSACCADKVRTIMSAALRHYADNELISFNYEGEYTYHLPSVIFRDQKSILSFLSALRHLYYGNPEHYLTELLSITSSAQTKQP